MNALAVLTPTPGPRAGSARLRTILGDAGAANLLLTACMSDTLAWASASADQLLVAYDGNPIWAAPLARGGQLVQQPRGNLGIRITAAVDAAFDRGAGRVVVTGSDNPTLPAAQVARCFDALDSVGAVIVPAIDGGWLALGVSKPLDRVLEEVAWGGDAILAETRSALVRDGRQARVAKPWYQATGEKGIRRLREEAVQGAMVTRAPLTAAALDGIASILDKRLGRLE